MTQNDYIKAYTATIAVVILGCIIVSIISLILGAL